MCYDLFVNFTEKKSKKVVKKRKCVVILKPHFIRGDISSK